MSYSSYIQHSRSVRRVARLAFWLFGLLLYLLPALWYSNLDGPITDEETERFMSILAFEEVTNEQLWRFRAFMEEDLGQQVIMSDAVNPYKKPASLGSSASSSSSEPANSSANHTSRFFSTFLKCRCHPLFMENLLRTSSRLPDTLLSFDYGFYGTANPPSPNNLEQSLQNTGLIRYRSRRDLMRSWLHPGSPNRNGYNQVVFPEMIVQPTASLLYLNDLRIIWAVLLGILLLTGDWKLFRTKRLT